MSLGMADTVLLWRVSGLASLIRQGVQTHEAASILWVLGFIIVSCTSCLKHTAQEVSLCHWGTQLPVENGPFSLQLPQILVVDRQWRKHYVGPSSSLVH